MKITVANTTGIFHRTAAARIVAQMCSNPRSVIGLSTGRTTGKIHEAVCRMHDEAAFDVSDITIFGLDEVTGVDREYFGACYKMLLTEVVEPLGISRDNYLMLPTQSDDFAAECRKFTDEIARRGGIDLLILGLGENGHLGFNQPGTPLGSGAKTDRMDERLDARIRRETNTPDDVALGGVTLGIRDIMHARRIIMVANGKNKTAMVKAMLEGPVSPDCPASVLQLHPNCEFIFDKDAAAAINIDQLQKI